jgi:hypothetical protein
MNNQKYVRQAQHKKGFASLVLIGVLIVLVAVGGYFLWSKKNEEAKEIDALQRPPLQGKSSIENMEEMSKLDNLSYYSEGYYGPGATLLKLTDGVYTIPFGCHTNSSTCSFTRLMENVSGDLNGDGQPDEVVVLHSRTAGGNGLNEELAIDLNQNGTYVPVSLEYDKQYHAQNLGDRTIINGLDVKNGMIYLITTITTPSGTNTEVTTNYKLEGNKLVVVN